MYAVKMIYPSTGMYLADNKGSFGTVPKLFGMQSEAKGAMIIARDKYISNSKIYGISDNIHLEVIKVRIEEL